MLTIDKKMLILQNVLSYIWTLIASLNAIVSNLVKKTNNKSYPEKWKFSQRKMPQVLSNQNKDIINFLELFSETISEDFFK